MLIRVVASLFLAFALLACDEVPEDPCLPIIRANPTGVGADGITIDTNLRLMQTTQDAFRASKCMQNQLTCATGGIPLVGTCMAAGPTGTDPNWSQLVEGSGEAPSRDTACENAKTSARFQCAQVSKGRCPNCQEISACTCSCTPGFDDPVTGRLTPPTCKCVVSASVCPIAAI